MRIEIIVGDWKANIEAPDDALALSWDNLSERYLKPVFSLARHRDCQSKSAVECVAEYTEEF